jgi:xanthine dehydrogenase/oxidase
MFGYNTAGGFTLFDVVGGSGYDTLVIPGRKYSVFYMSMSEVEVNMLTGEVQIIEFDGIYDVGSALNPTIDMNQLSGGYIYGLSSILHEERTYDNNGKVVTDNTWTYKPPCIVNIPQKSIVQFLTNKDTAQPTDPTYIPFSAKAVQEMAIEMSATALAALKGAIRTYRMENGLSPVYKLDVPATVDRIQQASGLNKNLLTF